MTCTSKYDEDHTYFHIAVGSLLTPSTPPTLSTPSTPAAPGPPTLLQSNQVLSQFLYLRYGDLYHIHISNTSEMINSSSWGEPEQAANC